MKRITDS